jgi:hypothetical protein
MIHSRACRESIQTDSIRPSFAGNFSRHACDGRENDGGQMGAVNGLGTAKCDERIVTRKNVRTKTPPAILSIKRGRAVLKCRARKVEITLLNAVGEGRNASVQREFRGGKCAPFPMPVPHPRIRLNGVARTLPKLCFGRGAPCVNLLKSGTSKTARPSRREPGWFHVGVSPTKFFVGRTC